MKNIFALLLCLFALASCDTKQTNSTNSESGNSIVSSFPTDAQEYGFNGPIQETKTHYYYYLQQNDSIVKLHTRTIIMKFDTSGRITNEYVSAHVNSDTSHFIKEYTYSNGMKLKHKISDENGVEIENANYTWDKNGLSYIIETKYSDGRQSKTEQYLTIEGRDSAGIKYMGDDQSDLVKYESYRNTFKEDQLFQVHVHNYQYDVDELHEIKIISTDDHGNITHGQRYSVNENQLMSEIKRTISYY